MVKTLIQVAAFAFIALAILASYIAIGSFVTRELAKRRPDLFRQPGAFGQGHNFYFSFALVMVAIWPLTVFALLLTVWAIEPIEKAWQERNK
jgi:hypothetical protein